MHNVHLPAIDLNLLVALDALLAEPSVTRAARSVGLSQSAMSHALARLRDLLGDPVLVRSGAGMVPTPRALALSAPIRRALAEIQAALSAPPAFVPETARRAFTIGTTDYGEFVLLPPLLAHLWREARGIDVRARPALDPAPGLVAGKLDLAVVAFRPSATEPGMRFEPLFTERFVCVMRKGHPLAKKKLTLARFVAAPHALIAPRGTDASFVDDALAKLGKKRRVAVTVPHFLVAPHVVAASDVILTLAERVARTMSPLLDLRVCPPPLALAGFSMSMMWHERMTEDPAHRWLRGVLRAIAAGI